MIKDIPISYSMISCFLECRIKYWKRYVSNIYWPSKSDKDTAKKGMLFHRLSQAWFNRVEPDLSGIPNEVLAWFEKLKQSFPLREDKEYYPEVTLEIEQKCSQEETCRIMVKTDLLIIDEDSVLIVDFKTGKIKRDGLNQRQSLQELVYMTVIADVLGEQDLSMMFWSPIEGNVSQVSYDWKNHESNKNTISKYINAMKSVDPKTFEILEDNKICGYCQYEGLCCKPKSF